MVKLKRLNKKKGFTMVELLAVIVILGILSTIVVVTIRGVIEKAKSRYYNSQEESMVAAARSYAEKVQSNLPKVPGQTTQIPLEELVKSKYIDEVVDYSKKNCSSENSYVTIFYYDNNYYYIPYLECDSYRTPLDGKSKDFKVKIDFSGGVNDATATIKIKEPNEGLASYQYKIYSNDKEVYSSTYLDGEGNKEEIKKTIPLTDYTPGIIKIKVTAINLKGLYITESNSSDYQDNGSGGAPECGTPIVGQSTVWTTSNRTIKVPCIDNPNGIGCAKDVFTQKFETSMEKGKVKISDKNGNSTLCDVDVYIDKEPPVVVMKAYKMNSTNGKDDGATAISTAQTTTNLSTANLKITSWLNGYNYPKGVYIEADYKDRSPIKKIEWALNSPGLKSSDTAAKNYRVVTETPMVKEGKYIIRIPDDGYRYGILTITDSTDQKAIINVEIAYDRTNPTTPNGGNIGGVSGSNSTAYTQNASGSNDTISGLKQYLYCIKNNNTAPNKEDSCFKGSNSFTRSCGKTYHAYTIAVDNAGNKSEVRDMGQTSDAADSWSGWSNCSKPCGGGRQTRSNSCALKGVQTRTCNNNPCTPPIPDAYKGTCNLVGQTQYLIRGGWYSPQCGNQTWAYIHYCADANGNLSASTLTFRLSNYNMAGVSQTSIINDTAFGCPRPPLNWYKIGSKNDGY